MAPSFPRLCRFSFSFPACKCKCASAVVPAVRRSFFSSGPCSAIAIAWAALRLTPRQQQRGSGF